MTSTQLPSDNNHPAQSRAYDLDSMSPFELNALAGATDTPNRDLDKLATRRFFLDDINCNTVFFHSLEEKLRTLVDENYYSKELLESYDPEFVKDLFKRVYTHQYRFKSFVGAEKFYTQYAMKKDGGDKFLERYEDRVVMNALDLANGDTQRAIDIAEEIVTNRFQPATPTFLNSGRARSGERVSCFLLGTTDSITSIGQTISHSLELSKIGGGVGVCLTNVREQGAPIKGVAGASSGLIPVMKLLEDAFSYADQLGQRQGAGAVYVSCHHPDIERVLDSKRENADEKIRIKSLSLGINITDIAIELAAANKDMYLFSPHDVERVYGVPMSEVSISQHYEEMAGDPRIAKKRINARKLFDTIAQLQFESGYPYLLFEDSANRFNPMPGRISMSNLCSEILVPQKQEIYHDGAVSQPGRDVSCNLGSLNVANLARDGRSGHSAAETIAAAIYALNTVVDKTSINAVPSVKRGTDEMRFIGLGVMGLHELFVDRGVLYGSDDSADMTKALMSRVKLESLRASSVLAKDRGQTFSEFSDSDYAHVFDENAQTLEEFVTGTLNTRETVSLPAGAKEILLEEMANGYRPSRALRLFTSGFWDTRSCTAAGSQLAADLGGEVDQRAWIELDKHIQEHGLLNSHVNAVAPTGSISYVQATTQSIAPALAIEATKNAKSGRSLTFAPGADTHPHLYPDRTTLIDSVLRISRIVNSFVDQGVSTTLYVSPTHTTRDVVRAYVKAWSPLKIDSEALANRTVPDLPLSQVKTLYYTRVEGTLDAGAGSQMNECVSCAI